MKKDKFTPILYRTLGYEGGVNENETGGTISNAGVTQPIYDSYVEQKKLTPKKVQDLNSKEIRDFYYDDLYKRPKLDKLPDKTSGVVFDYAVQSGDSRAVKALQEVVGAKADGIIGKKTIKKVKDYIKKNGEAALVTAIIDQREKFLTNLTIEDPETHGRNYQGFLNRISKLRLDYQSE